MVPTVLEEIALYCVEMLFPFQYVYENVAVSLCVATAEGEFWLQRAIGQSLR